MSSISTQELAGITLGEHAIGAEAYVTYCAGITVLQYPLEMDLVHQRDNIEDSANDIIFSGETLMYTGIRRIIADVLHGRAKLQERNYSKALPGMREVVELACLQHADRLNELNEMLVKLRPAPFFDRAIFGAVCRNDYGSIKTIDLMEGFLPDIRLMPTIHPNKTLFTKS